jgi:hypothetical protein
MQREIGRIAARTRSVASALAFAVIVTAHLACSGDTSATDGGSGAGGQDGGGSATDARPKIALTPADTLFELTSGDSLRVIVTDVAGACGYTMRSEVKASARGLVLTIVGSRIVPATYTVNPGGKPVVQAFFTASDSSCRPLFTFNPFAKDGSTIVIRSIASDRIEGSYALDFGGGTMLSGDFQATNCSPLSRQNPTCVK